MNKYIFPGADASTPLGWFVDSLEAAGFEIKSIDTIGVHYSATLWRWYRNWMSNKEQIIAKYGERLDLFISISLLDGLGFGNTFSHIPR
jgi:sphingolipid C9-methyltransferase